MPATVSADVDKPIPARPAAPRPRRARRPRDHGRWLREARGIVAMAVAGFAVVSLAVFDPALHPTEQGRPSAQKAVSRSPGRVARWRALIANGQTSSRSPRRSEIAV